MSTSPPRRGRSRTRSKSKSGKSLSRSKSVSPLGAPTGSPTPDAGKKFEKAFLRMIMKDDDEDQKSIKIPAFSDGTEWESVVFELEVNLEKVWKYKSEMDIVEYLQGITQFCDQKCIDKADKLIYFALVTAAKRDSFARKQIMASRHVDAVPQVKRNEGLKLFNLFQNIFLHKSTTKANFPNAQATFFQMKMNKKEGAKDYIARVDTAVSDLAILNEKVSTNSWLFILAKGLREEFKKSKEGVLFSETGYGSIPELKAAIMKEETILGISKPETKTSSETETANAVFEGVCNFCNKKGHKKADCFKFKKQQNETKTSKETYWCEYCAAAGHTTDYCYWNPANNQTGKGKAKGKGKAAKGKGRGKGKGKSGKGKKGGRANGNFPANYKSEEAHYAAEQWNSSETWESSDNLQDESSVPDWQDYSFAIFEKSKDDKFDSTENEQLSVLMDREEEDLTLTAWTQNNLWTEQDFDSCTWGEKPTFAAAKGGPECDFLFNVWNLKNQPAIREQLKEKL